MELGYAYMLLSIINFYFIAFCPNYFFVFYLVQVFFSFKIVFSIKTGEMQEIYNIIWSQNRD